MKLIHILPSCCLALLLMTTSVFAQTTQPELPPDVTSTLPSAELAGKGKLTFFGLDVYESSLWTTPSFRGLAFENHSFALELHYLRNFTAIDIAKRSIDEMQRIEPVPEQKVALWVKTLSEASPTSKRATALWACTNQALASFFGTTANAAERFAMRSFQGSFSVSGCRQKPLNPSSGKRFWVRSICDDQQPSRQPDRLACFQRR